MSNKEELRYLELRKKFQDELDALNETLQPLLIRQADLKDLLNGHETNSMRLDALREKLTGKSSEEKALDAAGFEQEFTTTSLHEQAIERAKDNNMSVLDNELVLYIENNPGSNRTDLNIYFRVGSKKEAKELSNSIGRLRKRGLIVNQGDHNRNAIWYTTGKI